LLSKCFSEGEEDALKEGGERDPEQREEKRGGNEKWEERRRRVFFFFFFDLFVHCSRFFFFRLDPLFLPSPRRTPLLLLLFSSFYNQGE
jgi:hypothetical protein